MQQRGILYSSIMHFVLLMLAIFGLPSIFNLTRDIQPSAISVEILPVSELSNVANRVKTPKEKQETPKEEPKPEQPKPAEKPAKKPEPPSKKEEPKPEEAVVTPKEDAKAEEKKPKEKKDKKPKEKDKSLDEILKDLEESSPEQATTPQTEQGAETTSKSDRYDPTMPMSMSEKDAIRSQFIQCWSMPAGSPNPENLVVTLSVNLNQDGTVTHVDIASRDKNRYSSDTFFRAAVDSAARAVWKCSPLKNLDPSKYGSWKEMELTFDPREMLY